jgi:large conductance mechanosensitive channel
MAGFREFLARGNVLDLAVAVIIGAAFGTIVTSLTGDIIMPAVGAIFGEMDFSSYFIRLGPIPAAMLAIRTITPPSRRPACRCWAMASS